MTPSLVYKRIDNAHKSRDRASRARAERRAEGGTHEIHAMTRLLGIWLEVNYKRNVLEDDNWIFMQFLNPLTMSVGNQRIENLDINWNQ